jgi:hypothetical protein
MVREYLAGNAIDLAHSYMIGDRDTDLQFAANLGMQGLRVRLGGTPEETWGRLRRASSARRAAPACTARPRKPTSTSRWTCRARPDRGVDGTRIFRSHARANREARGLRAALEVQRRSAHRRASHGRGLRARLRMRRCARRSATSAASRATGFCSRWTRPRRKSRSICPAGRISSGRAASIASASASCRPNWCRISFARSPKPWAPRCT